MQNAVTTNVAQALGKKFNADKLQKIESLLARFFKKSGWTQRPKILHSKFQDWQLTLKKDESALLIYITEDVFIAGRQDAKKQNLGQQKTRKRAVSNQPYYHNSDNRRQHVRKN